MLESYLRCCLHCGSLFPPKGRFLCADCWRLLEADRTRFPSHRILNGQKMEVHSLWDWIPNKNTALSGYLLALKGWSNEREWDFLAKELLRQRSLATSSKSLENPSILVPAPSHRKEDQDHALALAKALGRTFGLPMLPVLTKAGPQPLHQRGLGRKERAGLGVRRHEKFSQLDLSKHKVIFIDDVLTTGSFFTTGSAVNVQFGTCGVHQSRPSMVTCGSTWLFIATNRCQRQHGNRASCMNLSRLKQFT